MDLLLIRHGPAGEPDPAAWPDDDLRPLTPEGRKACKAAARGLREMGPRPSLILTSPAVRAHQTAAILADVLGLKGKALRTWDALHHGRAPSKALAALARERLPAAAALVGHEPWLGEFLSLLIAGKPGAGLAFGKGGAALVEIPDGAARAKGRGVLKWLLDRKRLAALA